MSIANDTEVGLGGNVYTHDLTEATRAVKVIETGIVWVDTPLNDNDTVPIGGRKLMGSGRQLGSEGLEQFLGLQMVMIASQAQYDTEWFPYPAADAYVNI